MAIPPRAASWDETLGYAAVALPSKRMATIFGASVVPRANDARPLEIQ